MWKLPDLKRSAIAQKGLWLIIMVVLVALWALAATFSDTYKKRLIADSTQELVQMNGMVTQHTLALLKTIRTDLYMIDLWLQDYKGNDPLNDPRFISLVSDLRILSGMLIDIRMVSSRGDLYYVPNPTRQALADVSDREYFKAQLSNDPRTLYVDKPIQSRVTGKWILPISWRLKTPVAGLKVIFAGVELDRLIEPHERWRIKNQGSILLIRDDGIVLSRAPFDPEFIGNNMSKLQAFNELRLQKKGTFITDSASTDGIARIGSFEHIEDSTINVIVTRSLDETLSGFYRTRQLFLWGIIELSMLVLVFAILIHRTQNALFKTQQDLQRLAMVDELTQVMNRRAFNTQAECEFSRAKRQNEDLAVLMLDLDFFKKINDNYGHAIGDSILVNSVQTWRNSLRQHDVLGRLGGEKFCILLPETDLHAAHEVAERLRQLTEAQGFTSPKGPLHVTVSMGLASIHAADLQWQSLQERADHLLYQAKQMGRNRVESG